MCGVGPLSSSTHACLRVGFLYKTTMQCKFIIVVKQDVGVEQAVRLRVIKGPGRGCVSMEPNVHAFLLLCRSSERAHT
jgi:hypothetical protein